MDKLKLAFLLGIGVVAYYLLLQWSYFTPPTEPTKETNKQTESLVNSDYSVSERSLSEEFDNQLAPMEPTPQADVSLGPSLNQLLVLESNLLKLSMDLDTGAFVKAELLGMKENMGSDINITLFDFGGSQDYKSNSGFVHLSEEQLTLHPKFRLTSVVKENTRDKTPSKVYSFTGESSSFIHERTVVLHEGRYDVSVSDTILKKDNTITEKVYPYAVILRNDAPVESGFMTYAYLGPVFSLDSDKYMKLSFEDLNESPFQEKSSGGWVALIQHYFLSAWVPSQQNKYLYRASKNSKGLYSVGYVGETATLSSGERLESSNTLFIGPKMPENLNLVHKDLGLAVDYGWLFWLGKPLYWVLNLGFSFFNNWGLAIIFLTVCLKVLLWPLSAAAYKSMAKMRALSPKLQELQTKHGSDKQKFSQEMMGLYQKEGVNPLGGCLPMLAQMPFFLAFYWVLIETVELRHAPFVFWIVDLSQRDPYFVLPILNAAGMYYSQTLTPTPPNADPMQAQMMKYMPLVFSVMFCFFPAGLVLYWLMNMLVTLVQQLYYLRPAK